MATKVLGWLLIVAGMVLEAVAIVALIVAYDGSRRGWASLSDAALVPIGAIVLGTGLEIAGVLVIRRRRGAA